jgi:hypothetical protein
MNIAEESHPFQATEHIIPLQDRPYLPVAWQLAWFRAQTGPRAGYFTIELEHDRSQGLARFLCVAWDGRGVQWCSVQVPQGEISVCGRVAARIGACTHEEYPDYYEAAATRALGRALAALGFGTPGARPRGESEDWGAIQPPAFLQEAGEERQVH